MEVLLLYDEGHGRALDELKMVSIQFLFSFLTICAIQSFFKLFCFKSIMRSLFTIRDRAPSETHLCKVTLLCFSFNHVLNLIEVKRGMSLRRTLYLHQLI